MKKTDKQKDVKRKQKSDSFGTILVSWLTSQVFKYLCASVLELKDTRQPFFLLFFCGECPVLRFHRSKNFREKVFTPKSFNARRTRCFLFINKEK